jgi:hypothetical protein
MHTKKREIDMTSNGKSNAGTIGALWRFPVKSMQGERLQQLEFTQAGVLGDRAYALIDVETGKVVSAKSIRLFPDLLQCKAEFVEAPKRGGEMPPARITLPTGRSIRSDERDVDQVLSEHFHRRVKLARAAPDDFTIDQYHPDPISRDLSRTTGWVVNWHLVAACGSMLPCSTHAAS